MRVTIGEAFLGGPSSIPGLDPSKAPFPEALCDTRHVIACANCQEATCCQRASFYPSMCF
jgi:hypothetical protein